MDDFLDERDRFDMDSDDEATEILKEVMGYIHSQGIATDEEVKSVIEEHVYDKIADGEMNDDSAADDLVTRVYGLWQHQKDHAFHADDDADEIM